MTIEVPVLRLGLAGYTEAQQQVAAAAAHAAATPRAAWQLGNHSHPDFQALRRWAHMLG